MTQLWYCSFRAVPAHQYEMMYANFYWNIKSHRQYNEYMRNTKN